VAGAVDDMALGGDEVTGLDSFDPGADRFDGAAELVPNHPRRLHPLGGPVAPLIHGQVRAADRGRLDPNQDLVVSGPRIGYLGNLDAGSRPGFDDCFQLAAILITLVLPTWDTEDQMVTAYVLINTSPGRAMDVAKKLQGTKGITVADAITGEYDVIARIEGEDVNAIGGVIVESIQKIEGVFKTVTCLAVT
jgi:DNA-binding Lrp family transcriptional regulator